MIITPTLSPYLFHLKPFITCIWHLSKLEQCLTVLDVAFCHAMIAHCPADCLDKCLQFAISCAAAYFKYVQLKIFSSSQKNTLRSYFGKYRPILNTSFAVAFPRIQLPASATLPWKIWKFKITIEPRFTPTITTRHTASISTRWHFAFGLCCHIATKPVHQLQIRPTVHD